MENFQKISSRVPEANQSQNIEKVCHISAHSFGRDEKTVRILFDIYDKPMRNINILEFEETNGNSFRSFPNVYQIRHFTNREVDQKEFTCSRKDEIRELYG